MLLSKFFLPELRPDRVNRPRLLERFQRSSNCRLVLISAPAGFGKTTLASEWVHAARAQAAWLSLDESDNDPVRFWTGLAAALDQLYPGVGRNSQSLLSARQPAPPQVYLKTLLNDLILLDEESADPQPACVVLDDIHLVKDAIIYEGLLYFIENLPKKLQLVLIGRSDPPIPLGRLRASGRVLEIRAADLRFSLDESDDFLKGVMGFPLSPEQVKRLEERTEGWIAGLQLAGLAIQGLINAHKPEAVAHFIDHFSGDDRYILDYLIEEVLNRLPGETRAFLLQTSILDRMCAPLCAEVTGLPPGESQAVLERLERENLFLVPLDFRREWYRYHHLFGDLLRHQLNRSWTETSRESKAGELHRRAAGWLAGQGLLPEAIDQALQAQDFEQAAGWIEAFAREAIVHGEYASLKRWVESLPQAVLYSRAELLLHYAQVLNYLGELTRYEQPLSAAEQLWRAEGNRARLGEALNLRADFAAVYWDGRSAAEFARRALDLLPDDDAYHRGMSWVYIGDAALLDGDIEKAQQAFTMGKTLCERSGNATGSRLVTFELAVVQEVQGKLAEAAALLEEVLSQINQAPIYEGLMARMLLGRIWQKWDRLNEAEGMLLSVLEVVEETGQAVYFQIGYRTLALIRWEMGDTAGMQAALDRQARLVEQMQDAVGQRQGLALRLQLAALSGDLETAQSLRASLPLVMDGPIPYADEPACLALARLLVRQGPPEAQQAIGLLDKVQEGAQAHGRIASLIEIWMLKALGFTRLHDTAAAVAALEESLGLAQPGGYQRLYLDEGQPLAALLKLLVRKPSLSPELRAYAAQLLNRASGRKDQPPEANTRSAAPALVEPLTPREIEVLRLIQAGCSNREIAEKLYLTLNTVKVHTKNIFGKLGVESRTQAVHRAGELGLI